jgi:signal transduction histidine kinase
MTGSIRNRLALVFLGITLTALAAVYAYVVPQLESSLRDEKLDTLARDALLYSDDLIKAIGSSLDEEGVNSSVRRAADASGARVTLFGVSRGTQGLQLFPISDSTADVRLEGLEFDVALDAARSGRLKRGSEPAPGGRLGEAARPLLFNGRVTRVVVYSQSLADVQRNVTLIRQQIFLAGAVALLLAAIVGYVVAGRVTRRVKRLEAGARKVAAGDFTERVPIETDDELGQLAAAFNDMQAQLAELEDARKRFIATASHELRTPLFSMGGFIELLESEELDEEERSRFLGQIREQVERLTKLATELLDLSRLEAGALDLRPEPTDLGALARSVAAEFTAVAAQHGSELELDAREGIFTVADPDRLAQIIRILLDNALAHTPPGTAVALSVKRSREAVTLAVEDQGPGIRREALGRLFEPFYAAGDAPGSGLGLAIARELAERMSGRLIASSQPGHTIFTLELPA